MAGCLILGGAGFVGTHLAKYFLDSNTFSFVHIADIRKSSLEGLPGIRTSLTDVREKIQHDLLKEPPEWIFNFAAIHREPGHEVTEYFETNVKGAQHATAYAEVIGCKNIFFTSTIAIYGSGSQPADESIYPAPTTPYGSSKYIAELIHLEWQKRNSGSRLIIVRPAVIFGPGDPGNILRMIRAIKKGYFAFPGSRKIKKSYAYIFGLMDSIRFTMNRKEDVLIYNYAETPTETIDAIAQIAKRKLNGRAPIISISPHLLMPIALLLQKFGKTNSPIHPVRVRRAGISTHVVPSVLIKLGFDFEYDFTKSIDHWIKISPEDFS